MSEQIETTAAHLEAVRHRGRWLMASEGADAVPYEVLHSCSAARDGAIIIFALHMILLAAGLAMLLLSAVVAGVSGYLAEQAKKADAAAKPAAADVQK